MTSDRHFDFCIVGAGPSGLTTAHELLRAGQKVLIIERDSRIGGLSKSYNYNGHIFDTGPKRFHTDDPVVLNFIKYVLKNNIIKIGRSTKVHFLGKFFDWPLNSKDIFKLPINTASKCFIDLIQKRTISDKTSFHEFITSKYGETLFQTFFAPYTRKFLRWDPEDLHSDWASTGINRSVIDKRIKANTLYDIFKGLMLPEKVNTEFLYPVQGGFGGFFEELASLCQSFDGYQLILGDKISGLENNGKNFDIITNKEVSFSCNQLIWSGNIHDLCRVIKMQEVNLHYINTIFYNIICREQGISNNRAQWIYVSKGNSLTSRITCMKEFAPYTCKDNYYNFICELTDSQIKPIYFSSPDKYQSKILDELLQMGFLKNLNFIEDIIINQVRDTYPVYHKRYLRDFASAIGVVKSFSDRIHLLGRSGAFWYNNSDHSIRMGIEMAKKLLGKRDRAFGYRDYFGGASNDNDPDIK